MILRNHGLLTVGATVPGAFPRLYRLERARRAQRDAAAAGPLRIMPDEAAMSARAVKADPICTARALAQSCGRRMRAWLPARFTNS